MLVNNQIWKTFGEMELNWFTGYGGRMYEDLLEFTVYHAWKHLYILLHKFKAWSRWRYCFNGWRRHHVVIVCMRYMHAYYALCSSCQVESVCEMELVFAAVIVTWAVALLLLRWRLKWRLHPGLTRCASSYPAINTIPAWPLMNPLAAAHLMLMSQLVMPQVLSDGNMVWWLCRILQELM
jgi:hypothetical protein